MATPLGSSMLGHAIPHCQPGIETHLLKDCGHYIVAGAGELCGQNCIRGGSEQSFACKSCIDKEAVRSFLTNLEDAWLELLQDGHSMLKARLDDVTQVLRERVLISRAAANGRASSKLLARSLNGALSVLQFRLLDIVDAVNRVQDVDDVVIELSRFNDSYLIDSASEALRTIRLEGSTATNTQTPEEARKEISRRTVAAKAVAMENLLRSLMHEESMESLMKHVDAPAPSLLPRSTLRERTLPSEIDISANPVVEEFMKTVAERQKLEELVTPTKTPTATTRVDSAIRSISKTPSQPRLNPISYGISTPKLLGYTKTNYAKDTRAAAARRAREPIKRIKLPPKTDQAKSGSVQPAKTLEEIPTAAVEGLGSKTPARRPSTLQRTPKASPKASPQIENKPRRALSTKAPAAGSTFGNVNSARPVAWRSMSVKGGKRGNKAPEHAASLTSAEKALAQALNEPDPPIMFSGRKG